MLLRIRSVISLCWGPNVPPTTGLLESHPGTNPLRPAWSGTPPGGLSSMTRDPTTKRIHSPCATRRVTKSNIVLHTSSCVEPCDEAREFTSDWFVCMCIRPCSTCTFPTGGARAERVHMGTARHAQGFGCMRTGPHTAVLKEAP